MRKLQSTLLIVAGLMLVAAPAAQAGQDLCYNAGGLVFAVKGHKVPKAGKCSKTFAGFTSTGSMVTGSECTSSDGTLVRVGYVISPGGATTDYHEIGSLEVPLPALTGGTNWYCNGLAGSWSCSSGSADVSNCTGATIPLSSR